MIAKQVPAENMTLKIVGDLLKPNDVVVLVEGGIANQLIYERVTKDDQSDSDGEQS